MTARQIPRRWLFADARLGEELWPVLRKLPRGAGIVVLYEDDADRPQLMARIRRFGRSRGLTVVDGVGRDVARVHDNRELRRALTRRTPYLFLSALHDTRSHPGRPPIPPMRAAALARLSGRRVFALGGMDERRFQALKRLGFRGWGGIDAWR